MTVRLCKRIVIVWLVMILIASGLGSQLNMSQTAHAGAFQPYLGEIQLFPYDRAPEGWEYAAGQSKLIKDNAPLFSFIGTKFGGNGMTHFNLPNLIGKAPEGMGYYIATQGTIPSREEGLNGAGNATLGEVRIFPYNFVPTGWLALNGKTYSKNQYADLYNMLGTTFDSSGPDTFKLPALTAPAEGLQYAISTDPSYRAEANGTGNELLGELIPYLVSVSAGQWLPANNRTAKIIENETLYILFYLKFGGDGRTNFGVPNLSSNSANLVYYVVNTGIFPRLKSNESDVLKVADDSYSTMQNTPLSIGSASGVLSNDQNALGAGVKQQPAHGTVVMNNDGSFVYTPTRGFAGNDYFVYEAANAAGGKSAYVGITVIKGSPPVISGVIPNGIYNKAVTPTFNEGTALLNGAAFASGTTVSAEGSYTLVATNNIDSTTVQFTIDLTAPVVTGVTNNAAYKSAPVITFNEGTATLDNAAFTSGSTVSSEGEHTLVVTDAAGNTTTVVFHVYLPRTITFDTDGGSAIADLQVEYEDLATAPTNPVKTGYSFAGWYADAAHTEPFDFEMTPITTNVTVYAKWSVNAYPVTFESNGGTEVASQSISYGKLAALPESPSRKGYTFAGWYTDVQLSHAFTFESTAVTEALTLYAKWIPDQYTVTFDTNGGSSIDSLTVDYGSHLSSPAEPTKQGYTFGGWYVDSAFSTLFDFSTTSIVSDTTIYAKWNINTYTVQFESNGGTIVNDAIVNYDSLVPPSTAPTRSGYTFMGWYSDPELLSFFDLDTSTITSDTILFAKWSNLVYTVQFDSNGGSTITEEIVEYGNTVKAPSNPTRTGYTFDGWYTDATFNTLFEFGSVPITTDTVLFARWIKDAMTVTFDTYGGSAIADITAGYGDTIIAPPAPEKAGYFFVGWYIDDTLTTRFDFNTPITSNLTLYADWSSQVYTISFVTYGGSTLSDVYVKYNDKITAPTPPTRSGYTFVNWYVDSGLETLFDFDHTAVTSDLMLHAKWKIKEDSSPGNNAPGNSSPGNSSSGNSSSNSNSSGNGELPDNAASTNGQLVLKAGQKGQVSLDHAVTILIPAGATTQPLTMSIHPIENPSDLLTNQNVLLSPVYELLKNVAQNFNIPITLTFTFDPSKVKPDQRAEVFYFDEDKRTWISTGAATVSGDQITTQVNHFTKFAVFAVKHPTEPIVPPLATSFTDIQGHWAEAAINQAVSEGIIKGYPDNTFKPGASVTRAEFTVMLMNLLQLDASETPLRFSDNETIGTWAKSSIARAVQQGFIHGDASGTFRPNAPVNRSEMAVTVSNVLGLDLSNHAKTSFSDQAKIPAWATSAVVAMKQADLLLGKGNNAFAPADSTTRAEAIEILLRMRQYMNQ
ncbi:putative repeat protein (TIGR02543 family) [Paenibacillus pabuli]|uniref:Repeat protein (TIGR02543 family) n=2 Tax=Paenibacillus pabuli TaxID=1472 RepID=A0ABX9BHJ4_9BACL|nr:putative repeat protein (TIGR02543 family) [Paenibacillus pabuli]